MLSKKGEEIADKWQRKKNKGEKEDSVTPPSYPQTGGFVTLRVSSINHGEYLWSDRAPWSKILEKKKL